MFNTDPNSQNRRPMDYETRLDRRAARRTAGMSVSIVLAAVFLVAIMIGVFVMSGPNTETANNQGLRPSMATRATSTTGSGAGTSTTPSPSTPADAASGAGR